jgi:hypothetical protein
MQIWISIVEHESGMRDVEILDSEPTDSFLDGLFELHSRGEISGFEIRMGFLNGGDSRIEYQSNG